MASTAPLPLTPEPTAPAATAAAPPAAPEPLPPAATAPAKTVPPVQEAHLAPNMQPPAGTPPSAAGGSIEAPLTILFEKDGARLPDEVRTALSLLSERLEADGQLQVQLLAYAEGDEENASKARRLSLSRALAVRSYLIDLGVRSTRIEVRALGNKVPEGPSDRVDVLVQKR
jgi:outer membrane protein OmpA-like peptidoglycan-associated protein